jgi:hypothetical protein
MSEQCCVTHKMHCTLLLLNVICLPLIVAQATYDDIELRCKNGEKVSAVRREKAVDNGRVGAMSVDCEPFTAGGLQVR